MDDPAMIEQLLPYHDKLEQRDLASLDLVVLHCTELPNLQMAREYGERIIYQNTGTGNSGHYYVDRDGALYRYVQDDRVARHVIGYNQNSIGIEIVNSGRYPDWLHSGHQICSEPYAEKQIESVHQLLRWLKQRYPQLKNLARHSDLDTQLIPALDDPSTQIRRKVDPGPLFPWEATLALWQKL